MPLWGFRAFTGVNPALPASIAVTAGKRLAGIYSWCPPQADASCSLLCFPVLVCCALSMPMVRHNSLHAPRFPAAVFLLSAPRRDICACPIPLTRAARLGPLTRLKSTQITNLQEVSKAEKFDRWKAQFELELDASQRHRAIAVLCRDVGS